MTDIQILTHLALRLSNRGIGIEVSTHCGGVIIKMPCGTETKKSPDSDETAGLRLEKT